MRQQQEEEAKIRKLQGRQRAIWKAARGHFNYWGIKYVYGDGEVAGDSDNEGEEMKESEESEEEEQPTRYVRRGKQQTVASDEDDKASDDSSNDSDSAEEDSESSEEDDEPSEEEEEDEKPVRSTRSTRNR